MNFQTGILELDISNWEKIQFIKLDISNWRIGKIQCR